MGLLEALDGITNKMNELADKVPLGAQGDNVQNAGTQGLGGLGNINTDNANGQLESPLEQAVKIDADSRKIAMDTTKFSSVADYKDYLEKWFNSTGLCTVNSTQANCITIQINHTVNNQNFVTSFEIIPVLTYNDVLAVLQSLQQSQQPAPTSRVIFGYVNYDTNQIKLAKQLNIEMVGANEILELNNAIELGLKKMPYITFDKKSFTHLFGSLLNRKYSDNTMGNGLGATFNQVTQNINDSMQNIGNNVVTEQQPNLNNGMNNKPLSSGVIELQNGVVNPDNGNVTGVSLEKTPENNEVSLKKEE